MCDEEKLNEMYFDCFDEFFYNENYKVTTGKVSKIELFNHWLKYGRT